LLVVIGGLVSEGDISRRVRLIYGRLNIQMTLDVQLCQETRLYKNSDVPLVCS